MRALRGNLIFKIDTKQKEKYALTKDVTIHIERGYNFNLREDRAAFGYVIDGEGLPSGAMLLCNYLALEPTYEITNETILTDAEKSEGFKVFSIPLDMAFCYNNGDGWKPCKSYLITKRIFKPYTGNLQGIEPELVKNRMYVEKGIVEWEGESEDLSGKVVVSLENCDYEIIFHTPDHREHRLIRSMDREIIAIDEGITDKLIKNKYLVGHSKQDCKYLNE